MTELEAVKGVGPAARKELHSIGVVTAELLAVQNPAELSGRTKIGEGTSVKIVRAARDLIGGFGFVSGLEIEEKQKTAPRLRTGIEEVDQHLYGGIEEGSIVEFYGPARGGKTQWVSQLAVRVQLPREEGGLDGRVLWLDTESSFKPHIIRANARRFGLDTDVALGNISRAEIIVSDQVEQLVEMIPKLCVEQDVKLVIIDSLMGLYRQEYIGLDQLKTRQNKMNSVLNAMRRTGVATGTIFAYTNQVTTRISTYGGNPNAPAGGHILSHGSDFRFYTRRKKEDIRALELQDNAGLPEFKIDLRVGWGGFYASSKDKKAKAGIVDYLLKNGYISYELVERVEAEKDIEEEEEEETKE